MRKKRPLQSSSQIYIFYWKETHEFCMLHRATA